MKNPYEDEDAKDRLRKAAMLSLGVTGGLAASQSIPQILRDRAEDVAVPKSRSRRAFLDALQEGDIMFSRKPIKDSGKLQFGAKQLPVTQNDVLNLIKGDPYYHSSVYSGRGNQLQAVGFGSKLKNSRMQEQKGVETRVYRPPAADAKAGLKNMKAAIGAPYSGPKEVIAHGAKYLAGMTEKTGQACKPGKNGMVCTEAVADAFPKLFTNKLAGPAEMRGAEGMELIARYGASKPKMRELLLSRLAHPLLKNAKWGLAAGALGLGATALKGDDDHG